MSQDIISIPGGSSYPVPVQQDGMGWKAMRQSFFAVFKWRRLILSLFIVFSLTAAVAMYFKPSVRVATAKILLKGDRIPLRISGLSTSSGGKGTYDAQVMQSEIEVLKSEGVMLPVAKKLLDSDGNGAEKIDPGELRGLVTSLTNSTVAVGVPGTTVMQVTYFAPSAEQAVKTLGLIIDEYLEQQAIIQNGSGKLLEFYQAEQERVKTELAEAEEKLRKWQEENQTVSIDEQISAQLRMLTDRQTALQQVESQIEDPKAKIATIRRQLQPLPERLVMSSERMRNPLVTSLRSDLVAAEVALQDLLQRYTEKDRRVQEKRRQIAMLKSELASAEKEGEIVGKQTVAFNPLKKDLEGQLAAAQSLLASLTSQKEALRRQVEEISPGLGSLREKKIHVDRLSREIDVRKNAFLLYGQKLEEARVAAGLGKEGLANIALIEQPHAKPYPDFMRRIALVLLAAVVGLALGIAIAFGVEFFNNSIRTQEDVEYYLGLPVLATIPDLNDGPSSPKLLTSSLG